MSTGGIFARIQFHENLSCTQFLSLRYACSEVHWARLWLVYTKWQADSKNWLTNINVGNLCNIFKCLTHAVPTCKRVKLMVKVWFSVLVYKTFKTLKETMKYALFDEVTIIRLKFWKLIIFQEFQKWWLWIWIIFLLLLFYFLWGRVKKFIFYTFSQM